MNPDECRREPWSNASRLALRRLTAAAKQAGIDIHDLFATDGGVISHGMGAGSHGKARYTVANFEVWNRRKYSVVIREVRVDFVGCTLLNERALLGDVQSPPPPPARAASLMVASPFGSSPSKLAFARRHLGPLQHSEALDHGILGGLV